MLLPAHDNVCNVKYNVSKYVFKCDSPWNLVLATHTYPIVFIPCTPANVSNMQLR